MDFGIIWLAVFDHFLVGSDALAHFIEFLMGDCFVVQCFEAVRIHLKGFVKPFKGYAIFSLNGVSGADGEVKVVMARVIKQEAM